MKHSRRRFPAGRRRFPYALFRSLVSFLGDSVAHPFGVPVDFAAEFMNGGYIATFEPCPENTAGGISCSFAVVPLAESGVSSVRARVYTSIRSPPRARSSGEDTPDGCGEKFIRHDQTACERLREGCSSMTGWHEHLARLEFLVRSPGPRGRTVSTPPGSRAFEIVCAAFPIHERGRCPHTACRAGDQHRILHRFGEGIEHLGAIEHILEPWAMYRAWGCPKNMASPIQGGEPHVLIAREAAPTSRHLLDENDADVVIDWSRGIHRENKIPQRRRNQAGNRRRAQRHKG